MREDISLGGFPLSIGGPSCALKASGLQDFGAQDFKAKASGVALCGFNQPIQGFGVSVAHPMIEIRKDRPVPVAHSRQQGLKGCFQMGRNAGTPRLVCRFGLGAALFQPDIEEAFFQPVGGFQIREIFRPGFQDQAFRLVQIAVAMQQNIPVMHQALALRIRKRRFNRFAYGLKALVGHLDDVEVIDDHLYEIREVLSYCDTSQHRGTLYRACNFTLRRVNDRGIETYTRPLRRLTHAEHAEIARQSHEDVRAKRLRAGRTVVQHALFAEVPA